MGIKSFILKQTLKAKLKGVPKEQQEIILSAVEKNPDFFQMISKEVKRKKKTGMSEEAATMQVMREHQGEFQKIMR